MDFRTSSLARKPQIKVENGVVTVDFDVFVERLSTWAELQAAEEAVKNPARLVDPKKAKKLFKQIDQSKEALLRDIRTQFPGYVKLQAKHGQFPKSARIAARRHADLLTPKVKHAVQKEVSGAQFF